MYLSLQERSSDSSDSEATRRWLGCFRRRHTEPPSDLEAYEVSTEDSETSDEKIQDLHHDLVQKRVKLDKAEEQLHRVEAECERRTKELAEAIKVLEEELDEKYKELDECEALEDVESNVWRQPGPRWLRWLEEDVFAVVSTAVVVLNVVIIVEEYWQPRFLTVYFWLDQAFLLFYIVELVLRGILMRQHLLCGPCQLVFFGWLDLIIVAVGVVDQWILPAVSEHQGRSWLTSCVRILRLLRLLRLMKVFRNLQLSQLDWVEENCFQGFVLFAILMNCLLLGLQTDMPNFQLWNILAELLLLIFLFELVVRIRRKGWDFFLATDELFWNLLDFIIVASAVVENWLFPVVNAIMVSLGQDSFTDNSGGMGSILTLLRMARLFRILRLARLVHSLPPLQDLLFGVVNALHDMFWVLVLTGLLLYCSAILAMTFVEDGLIFKDGVVPEQLRGLFPDVAQAMFVLFLVMNGDMDPISELLGSYPLTQFFTAVFVVISNWAILAIFTAVVGENMITSVEDRRAKQELLESADRTERSVVKLTEFFRRIPNLNREPRFIFTEEFHEILRDPEQEAELCDAAGLSSHELKDLLKLLCHKPLNSTRSYITEEALLSGLKQQNDAANERSMMRLEKQVMHLEDKLRHWMQANAHASPLIPLPPSSQSPSPRALPQPKT